MRLIVSLCLIQTIFTLEINHHSRRTGHSRDGKKLFGGYRITPRFCKPTRKLLNDLGGPNICMFNHECTQRNGQVVGACMDGFLFGACCQLPSSEVGELIDSDLVVVGQPDNELGFSKQTTVNRPVTTTADYIHDGVSKITANLLSDQVLPTAQDNVVVQVSGDYGHFSTPGLTHSSHADTYLVQPDNNEVKHEFFKPPSKPTEHRKTTYRTEGTTMSYQRPTSPSPFIQISISNAPDYYTPRPQERPPMHDGFILVPTISHPPKNNKTQEFESVVNILQMLNESTTVNTSPNSPLYTYSYISSNKPPSTSYVFSLTPSRRPITATESTIQTSKKPLSTSYVFSLTPTRRPTTETTSVTTRKPPSTSYIFSSSTASSRPTSKPSKPTKQKPTKPSTSSFYYQSTKPTGHSTFASTPSAFITKKPPSTSYVHSSTASKRPVMTASTVTSPYTVTETSSSYPIPSNSNLYASSPPTIIILSPSTSAPLSGPYVVTQSPPKKKPVTQVTINNHVTHNSYGTPEPTSNAILITPKPSPSTSKPYRPTTDYYTPQIEVETSVNDLINFPPVRNPNLNISASVYDTDFTTPEFLEDDALNIKMENFVNKIVQSLQEPFQGLKDVVYNKNTTVFTEVTTKKPVKKTTTSNAKPSISKKPSTKRPLNTSSSKRPSTSTKKTSPPKRITTTESPLLETETEFPAIASDDYRRYCGRRPLLKSGRIVGGKGAAFGQFPWQVLVRESTWLGLFTKNKCGGVLISNRFVMTAAHCQPGFLASLVAVFGEHDISGERESKRSLSRNVKKVIVHRKYDAATFENDLALLELEHPVQFDEHIVPICLPREDEDFTGRMATVTGWGRLKYGGGVPSILQEVQVPIMENQVCQEMFRTAGHSKVILESFLCAGYANGQKDSCEGDSGGPLVLQRPDGRYQLAGTVSHGIKCAAPYLPGVYMRTAYYKPWIETVTGVQ